MQKRYKSQKVLPLTFNILTILAAIALAGSYAACFIDPRTFWPPAFLGLAYVPLFFLNLLLLIINIARRKWISLLPVAGILLSWNILVNTFSFHRATPLPPKPSPSAIRILTWNIHYFEDDSNPNRDSSRNEMLTLAQSTNADVICMQEFSWGDQDSSKSMARISNHLRMPYFYFQRMESPSEGMAIFSKYPLINKGMIRFSYEYSGNQGLFADIKKDNKIFRVYTVHLESIRLQNNQLNYISKLVKGKERTIRPSKKIAGQLKRAFQNRSEQVFLIKHHAKNCPYPYLVCGDFNDPPSSYSFHEMSRGLENTFAEKGHGILPVTYYRGLLKYQIDHILINSGFRTLDHHIITRKLSDHYPVCATLELK